MLAVNLPVDIAVIDKIFQVINLNEIQHLTGTQSLHEHYYHLSTSRYILHVNVMVVFLRHLYLSTHT